MNPSGSWFKGFMARLHASLGSGALDPLRVEEWFDEFKGCDLRDLEWSYREIRREWTGGFPRPADFWTYVRRSPSHPTKVKQLGTGKECTREQAIEHIRKIKEMLKGISRKRGVKK